MNVTTQYRMVTNANGRILSLRLNSCRSLIVPVALKKMKFNDGSRNVIRNIRKINQADGCIGWNMIGKKNARMTNKYVVINNG